jgi:hypothetical protein
MLIEVEFLNELDPVRFEANLGFTGLNAFQELHAPGNHRFLWVKDPMHLIYFRSTTMEKSIAPFLQAIGQYQVQ